MLCLIQALYVNSQSSTNDTMCIVPCEALRNAIIRNVDYKLTQVKLQITSDSIVILNKIILEQDSLTDEYSHLNDEKNEIISLKDTIIREQKLQIIDLNTNVETLKKQRNKAAAGGVLGVLIGIALILVF